jgi:hypothetical protein
MGRLELTIGLSEHNGRLELTIGLSEHNGRLELTIGLSEHNGRLELTGRGADCRSWERTFKGENDVNIKRMK